MGHDISMIWCEDQREIAKIVHSYLERGITCECDIFNSPPPPIYIGPVKIKTLKERLEENTMKTTSKQEIKNIRDISFSFLSCPIEMNSTLTVIATTDDDIFEFVFEGEHLIQSCERSGLFNGWEKDQKIRELETDLGCWKKEAADCLRLRDEAQKEAYKLKKENEKYEEKIKKLEHDDMLDKDAADYWSKEHDILLERFAKLQVEYEKLKDKLENLEELKTPTIEDFADKEPSNRRDILKAAEKCVCGHREQDYGTPESNFQLIADLWNDYLKKEKSSIVVDAMDVSMMMALLKIARIRNGGGSGDSFVDLAGYAACGGELWHLKKETNGDSN